MSEDLRKQMIYLSSLDIIRRMLKDGIASREVLERLNRRNAESMGCKPVPLHTEQLNCFVPVIAKIHAICKTTQTADNGFAEGTFVFDY